MANTGSLTGVLDLTTNVGGEGGVGARYISEPAPAPEPQVEPTLPICPPVCRQITCSKCGVKGHTFTKCPQKG